jgi:putative autotransporter adhesin-like protein
MKTSNKILLISGSSLIGIVIVFMLIFRLTLGNSIVTERLKDSDQSTVFREFPLAGFTSIEVSGQWEVELISGDTIQVKVKGPGDLVESLSVKKRARTLILSTDKKWRHSKRKVTALITMPSLSDLRLNGLVSLELKGFTSEHLTINTSGVTSIMGKGNHIRNLNLTGKGVSNLNLRQNSVINADLNYKGVYKIELSMAGGELTGKIKGVGKVIYNGEVRKESIRKEGPNKVIREHEI